MSPENKNTSLAIIGGGLAGLSLSILCAQKGINVELFEKGNYPSHKLCGEYVSLESWSFLTQALQIDLQSHQLPLIKKLVVSSHTGKALEADLPLGGFGISRYLLDQLLYQKALEIGIKVHCNCSIQEVSKQGPEFHLKDQDGQSYTADLCIGAQGKRSNIDKWLQRDFFIKSQEKHNYIAVKYHIKTTQDPNTIALHNFHDGYCGISKVEGENTYCLCYLTTAKNLKRYGSIEQMEQNLLYKNPFLKKIFQESIFLWEKPITISQINFSKKELIKNDVICIGDAAGMIQPLCGNGMSMAFHTAFILSKKINNQLDNNNLQNIQQSFQKEWRAAFSTRLKSARWVEKLFGKKWSTYIAISLLKKSPLLTKKIIQLTHGKDFFLQP